MSTWNLLFDGQRTHVEIPDSEDFSVSTTGGLSVSAWMRPDVLTFLAEEAEGYVHLLGKGEAGRQEWTFRIYGADTTAPADTNNPDGPTRSGRVSFYVFNPEGHLGVGSYFQDELTVGVWMHVVGTVDTTNIYIYRDGIQRNSQKYAPTIVPTHGTANVRIGTRDFKSFFQGSIREVRVWNRCLTAAEVAALYDSGTAPAAGLVAEYLLTADVALDTSGLHNGNISFGSWMTAM